MTAEELDFFNYIAPKWDSMEVKSLPDKVNEILDTVNVRPGDRVADLGTGTGVLLPYLSERCGDDGRILAVDFSDGMLLEAIRKYIELENVDFLSLDFENSPLDGRFDIIFLYCVYPHLNTPFRTLRRLVDDNLKPGGRIIIAFPSDERFINNIHHHREVEDGLDSDLLPSATKLARSLSGEGFNTKVLAYSPEKYIVEISAQ